MATKSKKLPAKSKVVAKPKATAKPKKSSATSKKSTKTVKKSTANSSLVGALVVVILVAALSFAGLHAYQANKDASTVYTATPNVHVIEKTLKNTVVQEPANAAVDSETPASNQTVTTTTTTPAAFDIEAFYAKVQNGMTLSQVKDLASDQSVQCVQTGSVNSGPTCIWKSGSKSVYVSFDSSNKVTGKTKDGF